MTEKASNKDTQISFRLPEQEKNVFIGKVKGSGLDMTTLLRDFVRFATRDDAHSGNLIGELSLVLGSFRKSTTSKPGLDCSHLSTFIDSLEEFSEKDLETLMRVVDLIRKPKNDFERSLVKMLEGLSSLEGS